MITDHFKHGGKTYTLYKRDETRDGAWWLKTIIKGKSIRRSLKTNLKDAAIDRAIKDYIRPAMMGNMGAIEVKVAPAKLASVGEILSTYAEFCIGLIDPATVQTNTNAMRIVIRRGFGDDDMSPADVDAKSSAIFTGKLIGDFELWMGRRAVADGRDLESNKRTVEGYVRQARSVFSVLMMPKYRDRGTALPDLKEFMERATARAANYIHAPVSDTLLQTTFAEAEKWKLADRPAFIAWLLGCCTLRRREVGVMRWDWIKQVNGRYLIDAEDTKNGSRRQIPIDERVASELEDFRLIRLQSGATDDGFVLPSGPGGAQVGRAPRLRGCQIFKRVNKWMRTQGWTTRHTMHEMRAFAIAMVADNYGLRKAQAVAGHASERTTQKHYAGMGAVDGVIITLPLAIGQDKTA